MNYNYDECLQDNPFLQEVFKNYSDIVSNAVKNKWIICVPRLGVFDRTNIKEEDVLEHVLVPDVDSRFCTLSKHEVNVNNKQLVKKDGTLVNILFDETVYNGVNRKYTLLCLDNSLSDRGNTSDELFNVQSLRDCVQLLWTGLDEFQKLIEVVSFEQCVDLRSLFEKYEVYFDVISKTLSNLVQNCDSNNFSLAVETYFQHCTYTLLFTEICSLNASSEGRLNKIICNHSQIQLKDLNIDNNFFKDIKGAKRELYSINKFPSTLTKINCLKRTVELLSHNQVTADDLLKIFVFLILRSNINNWLSNLVYMNKFRLSCLNLSDENAYLVTTLEAAIEYIKQNDIFIETTVGEVSKLNTLQDLFTLVAQGNLNLLKEFFNDKTKNTLINSASSCHPLCSCDKCEAATPFTINSTDDTGSNALHVVALHGHVHIMEYLIGKGIDFNVVNSLGFMPIHNAANKGHQNALLFLLHSNSAFDTPDCNGNTPLHLAANCGHESCVKALLYFTEQKGYTFDVNCKNTFGDTPLHFASKWSFIGIVQILLEYGADANITNTSNQTAFDVAHNNVICKILSENTQKNQTLAGFVIIKKYDNGVRPSNRKQLKKIALIHKAIENNDLPLMCFHLGIPTPKNTVQNLTDIKNTMCHPLCTCSKCEKQFEIIFPNNPQTEILNVNTCNLDGYTSLHVASKCGINAIVKLLLDFGALVNLKTYANLYTPLHLACIHGHLKVVQELIKCNNCNVNEVDVFGNTSLHYACINNDNGIIDVLLNCCGNCNVKNNLGKTPFQLTTKMQVLTEPVS